MSTVTKLKPETETAPTHPLARLREPFPAHQISKLPKESKQQADERKANRSSGVNCQVCGGWHHRNAVHLDYVGHAALTDRLLDTDLEWDWEPLAFTPEGFPALDRSGGLWIKLTVCGKTRLGYGSADGKSGGDAIKELIGDALRNAAMRFGAALDLWHKGDLHVEDEPVPSFEERAIQHLRSTAVDRETFRDAWESNKAPWRAAMDDEAFQRVYAVRQEIAAAFAKAAPKVAVPPPHPPPAADAFDISDDEIPF